MVFVDTVHCPDSPEYPVRLRCLSDEYNSPNHLVICHEFAPGQQCRLPLRRQRFCVDRYEYPNDKGGHPPVMVSAYDAAALCAEKGKRLCWESEWTAACEGPDKLPFPYGLKRSKDKCNIDNLYAHPSLDNVYHKNAAIQDRELRKLDQSVPSGSKESCKSGFGVYDLTGNFDEWVLTEQKRGKGEWAGLKGGAWGRVRNACRPITTSHVPEFTYYFISLRCCRDAAQSASPAVAPKPGEPPLWIPPPAPTPKPPGGKLSRGWTPK
jgi:sulfatase modifying factor 1